MKKEKSQILKISLIFALVLVCLFLGACDKPVPPVNNDDDDVVVTEPLAAAIAALPQPASLDYLFNILEGYWATADEYSFVGFFKGNNQYNVETGLWETECWESGYVISALANGPYKFKLEVFFPETQATEEVDGGEAYSFFLEIDMSSYNANQKIKILHLEDNQWYTYFLAGADIGDAYDAWIVTQ